MHTVKHLQILTIKSSKVSYACSSTSVLASPELPPIWSSMVLVEVTILVFKFFPRKTKLKHPSTSRPVNSVLHIFVIRQQSYYMYLFHC